MPNLTVSAPELKEHNPVTTVGTIPQAIRAFLGARGLDGFNLDLHIVDEQGKRHDVTKAQCSELMAANPREAVPQVVQAPEPTKEEPKEESTPTKPNKK